VLPFLFSFSFMREIASSHLPPLLSKKGGLPSFRLRLMRQIFPLFFRRIQIQNRFSLLLRLRMNSDCLELFEKISRACPFSLSSPPIELNSLYSFLPPLLDRAHIPTKRPRAKSRRPPRPFPSFPSAEVVMLTLPFSFSATERMIKEFARAYVFRISFFSSRIEAPSPFLSLLFCPAILAE